MQATNGHYDRKLEVVRRYAPQMAHEDLCEMLVFFTAATTELVNELEYRIREEIGTLPEFTGQEGGQRPQSHQ